jgi:hypothetical protein
VSEVTREEVKMAITLMHNNHAPGEDGLPAQLFKYGGREADYNSMYTLIRSVRESEEICGDWSLAVICQIYE